MAEAPGPAETLRLDKWLWHARFAKSRSLAARLVQETGVRVNGARAAKAAAPVRPGDVLTFAQGRVVRVVRIVALGGRRGPATEAQALYDDLDPPQPNRPAPEQTEPAARPQGSGRPTKAERRALDRLRSGGME
jgi:ribosome-associated heat shock protein Hsp15